MDGYEYWRAMLDGTLASVSDTPQCGFYRRKFARGAPWQPVAFFHRDGELVCVAGEREAPVHHVWSLFLEAITEDAYRTARRVGRFPDDLETHQHATTSGPLTTDLRDATAILPITGDQHGRNDAYARGAPARDWRKPAARR